MPLVNVVPWVILDPKTHVPLSDIFDPGQTPLQRPVDGNTIELGPLTENHWIEALFGPNNVSLKNIQNLKLIKYLKQLHEDENVEHPSGRTRVIF